MHQRRPDNSLQRSSVYVNILIDLTILAYTPQKIGKLSTQAHARKIGNISQIMVVNKQINPLKK